MAISFLVSGKSRFLTPNIQNIFILLTTEDMGVCIVDAMKALYSSEIYSKLEDESTKAWNFGPVALYEEFQTERS